ncbi:MAG: SpoVG family protein [Planctomycetales bacterium]|nr:SpoVG family protein [Planctomycetales bacterium]
MEITEVRIKLMEDSDDRLQAFCSITFDNSFVVRDLKIIEGTNGPFVAMPSRKLTCHCHNCGSKNHLRANYCNDCGVRMRSQRDHQEGEGRVKLYADIAHPINSACREMIQSRVIADYREEQERAKQPGYVSRYDDYFDYDDDFDYSGDSKVPLQGPHRRPGVNEPRGEREESEATGGEKRTPHSHLRRGPSSGVTITPSSGNAGESQPIEDSIESPRQNPSDGSSDGASGFGAGIFD